MSNISRSSEEENDADSLLFKKQLKNTSSVQCKLLVWNVWSIANEEKMQNFLQTIDEMEVDIACKVGLHVKMELSRRPSKEQDTDLIILIESTRGEGDVQSSTRRIYQSKTGKEVLLISHH